MKNLPLTISVLLFIVGAGCLFAQQDKHRMIVLADMGNEPDEEQQMVHMMMYSNEFDIQGLIAVSGKYLHSAYPLPERTRLYPDLFHKIIDAYQKDLPNLEKHATGWPDPDYLRSIVKSGQPDYGIAGVGPGFSSQGSEHIIECLEKDDPRPLYVVVNAGSNTLAQAIIDYEAAHSEAEVDAFIGKLRVFENGAQDNAGAWICANYPEIHWVRSNYQTYCYGGPRVSGNLEKYDIGPYTWEPYDYSYLGQHHWALDHIIVGHGQMGKTWPMRIMGPGHVLFLEGGGTIPWMGLIHQGLWDISQPHWGGWSGRFTRELVKNEWSRHQDIQMDEENYGNFYLFTEAADSWVDPETGHHYTSEFTPIWRWRRAMFNDFACRMDWCVKGYEDANHPPHAAINGDRKERIHIIHADAGGKLVFDASASSDPDQDSLAFSWWIYREPGTYAGILELEHTGSPVLSLELPADSKGSEIHLILEVRDDNQIAEMYDYRRVIINCN